MSDKITDRFTERAKRILVLANQESHRWNHEYIGTEHILIGLFRESSGIGAHFLKEHGFTLESLRTIVGQRVKPGPDMVIMGKLPYTPRVKRVLEHAVENARSLGHNYVGTEHLLLGLLDETDSIAYEILLGMDISKKSALREVKQLIGGFDEEKECCFDCDKFDICSFAKNLNESDPTMLKSLFGEIADSVCEEVFKFFGGRCKKFERKSE